MPPVHTRAGVRQVVVDEHVIQQRGVTLPLVPLKRRLCVCVCVCVYARTFECAALACALVRVLVDFRALWVRARVAVHGARIFARAHRPTGDAGQCPQHLRRKLDVRT